MFKKIWNVLVQVQDSIETARHAIQLGRTGNPEQVARYFNQTPDSKAICPK